MSKNFWSTKFFSFDKDVVPGHPVPNPIGRDPNPARPPSSATRKPSSPILSRQSIKKTPTRSFMDCFSILVKNQLKPCASGVLISENAILSVNHFRKSNRYINNFWEVTNSNQINNRYRVSCLPMFPLKILNEDLEILITEKSITNALPIEFASTQEINQAKQGLIVGYGADERGVSGIKRLATVDIQKCSGTNVVRYNCNAKRHILVKAPAVFQQNNRRMETDGINYRDSGCPLYVDCKGKIKLAGIASMSLDGGKAGLFIRVDTYEKEIKKILARFPPEN